MENHFDFIRNKIKNDKILSSILYLLDIKNSKIDQNLWSELYLFENSEVKFSIDLNNKKTFKDLLELPEINIIKVKYNSDSYYKEFKPEDHEKTIITSSFNKKSIWIDRFLREWHLKSGFIETETNDDFIKYKFIKSKTEENNLAILMCQEFMDDENTRMSLSKSYLENIGLEELSYLCCSSQAHYNILGKENNSISEESIIL